MTAKNKERVAKLSKSYANRRKTNPVLHVIKADGTVTSAPWKGKLECGAPPYEKMYSLIDCRCVEHVMVLFNSRKLHSFVDEEFGLKANPQPAFNWKASALYANWRLYESGCTQFLYTDLKRDPPLPPEAYFDLGLYIQGTMLLWEGVVR